MYKITSDELQIPNSDLIGNFILFMNFLTEKSRKFKFFVSVNEVKN